jgi:tetratricopeptide (TPR) repeat protein
VFPASPGTLPHTWLGFEFRLSYAVVPFAGREQQLDALSRWADNDDTMAVRLVHGAAGQGKTRLAVHVGAMHADAGWAVWRVLHRPAAVGGGSADRLAMPASGRVLVVVDYADRWPTSHLLALIGDLRDIGLSGGLAVRVLLLARSTKHWWPTVEDRLDGDYRVEARALALPSLTEQIDPGVIFCSARDCFAERLGLSGAESVAMPPLLHLERHTLAVHMAALTAVDAHYRQVLAPSDPWAVSAYLLRREHAYWKALHERAEDGFDTDPTVMGRATYVATLVGALHRPDAHVALRDAGLASSLTTADRIIDDHAVCYPPGAATMVLEPLHPDRLGEDLVGLATPGHPHQDGELDWLVDDWTLHAPVDVLIGNVADPIPFWAPAAITMLAEASRRWPHLATDVLSPLLRQRPDLALAAGGAAITCLAGLDSIDPAILEGIDAILPDGQHVDLDVAAAAVSTRLYRYRLASTRDPVERASVYIAHARRLGHVSRDREALTAVDEALDIYRPMAAAGMPPETVIDLIDALILRGLHLSKLGRPDEAAASTGEALAVFRQLTAAVPAIDTAVESITATQLHNLATFLHEMGLLDQAERLFDEVIAVRRRLVDRGTAWDRASLALSLTGLAAVHSDLGQPGRALETANEALAIRRALADSDASTYLPDLAAGLNNIGAMLLGLERNDAAYGPIQEAIDLYLQLVAANPEHYLPQLAGALVNLGTVLMGLDQRARAVAPIQDAVAVYRQLAATNPLGHIWALSLSLHKLGRLLAELERWEEAHEPIEQALAIRWARITDHAVVRLGELGASLDVLVDVLTHLGRRDEALAAAHDLVGVRRRLVDVDPELHLPGLAQHLLTLGRLLWEVERASEAVIPIEEAIGIFRRLASADLETHGPALAATLTFHAAILCDLGRFAESAVQADEAVKILRPLTESDPDRIRPALACALYEYARAGAAAGHSTTKALMAVQDAIQIFGPLAEQRPEDFGSAVTLALQTLAEVLNGLGHTDEATDLQRQLDQARMNQTRTEIRVAFRPTPESAVVSRAPTEEVESGTGTHAATPVAPQEEALASFQRGVELLERGALEEAHTAFEEAMHSNLCNAAMLYDGVVHYREGNLTGAMINWLVIAAMAPDTICAYRGGRQRRYSGWRNSVATRAIRTRHGQRTGSRTDLRSIWATQRPLPTPLPASAPCLRGAATSRGHPRSTGPPSGPVTTRR